MKIYIEAEFDVGDKNESWIEDFVADLTYEMRFSRMLTDFSLRRS